MPDPEHSEIGFPDAVQLFRSFAGVARAVKGSSSIS